MRRSCALVIVACLSLLTQKSLGEIRYSITDLGTLGGANSYAGGINNSGQVVGNSDTGSFFGSTLPIEHAFLFDGTMHDISVGATEQSYGNAINRMEHVAGVMDTVAFMYDGFYRFAQNSGNRSWANAINDS